MAAYLAYIFSVTIPNALERLIDARFTTCANKVEQTLAFPPQLVGAS